MAYRPRMEASVTSIVTVHDVNFLQFDEMVIDHWRVEARHGAAGEYVSPDPRFVVFFDNARIKLDPANAENGVTCNACFVPAGVKLRGAMARAGYLEHIDIHLDGDLLRRIAGPSVDLQSVLFLTGSNELQNLSALIADECRFHRRPLGYSEALARSVIHEVFYLGDRQNEARGAPSWFEAVTDHIEQSLDQRFSIDELASVAGMSRSQFSKNFRELAGVPPHQWVMCTRIEHAQRLLSDGVLLSQVAHETGFADQAHFSRCFRRQTGMPPGQWCKRYVYSKDNVIVQDNACIAI